MPPRLIIVTGTGTGVGKTVFTASLLGFLRGAGHRVLGMKPFCSGGRGDAELLQAMQSDARIPDDQVNPFYFDLPVTPMIAARKERRVVPREKVIAAIRSLADQCDCLLIEGAGGLMAPLGEGYTLLDLMNDLAGGGGSSAKRTSRSGAAKSTPVPLSLATILVGRNELGTLNHVFLTVAALRSAGHAVGQVVLMEPRKADESTPTNASILRDWIAPISIGEFPYLGSGASRPAKIRSAMRNLRRPLAATWRACQ